MTICASINMVDVYSFGSKLRYLRVEKSSKEGFSVLWFRMVKLWDCSGKQATSLKTQSKKLVLVSVCLTCRIPKCIPCRVPKIKNFTEKWDRISVFKGTLKCVLFSTVNVVELHPDVEVTSKWKPPCLTQVRSGDHVQVWGLVWCQNIGIITGIAPGCEPHVIGVRKHNTIYTKSAD